MVGARILPVGPSIDSTASLPTLDETSNSCTFLPFMATSLDASFSIALASDACSFLLAMTVSRISILLASKNLDALVQVVHPFLK